MAPEWQRPEELTRLVAALRATEARPRRRWSELLGLVRRGQERGEISQAELLGRADGWE